VNVPAPRGFLSRLHTVSLNSPGGLVQQTTHFPWMWSYGQKGGFAVAQLVCASTKGVQAIGVKNHGKLHLPHHTAHEFLRFRVSPETRSYGKNCLSLDDLCEALV